MAVILKRLYEQIRHMEVELVAGAGGMDHPVRWVHMVESLDATSFLDGGEIAFTTGIGLNGGEELCALVQTLYENRAAGVMINTGPFLKEVDEAVIRFGDEHDFPIFVIPWKVHLARIIQIISFSITKSEQKDTETASAFINAISFPLQEELYVAVLSRQGFRVGWNYCAAAFKPAGPIAHAPRQTEQAFRNLQSHLEHYYKNFALFPYDGKWLLVLGGHTDDEIRAIVCDCLSYLNQFLGPDDRMDCGAGRSTRSIRCLGKSFDQARSILRLKRKGKLPPSLVFYNEMGLYKLILGVENRELLKEYYDRTLAPLISYDSLHGTDYTGLLKCYLEHDCRKNETAASLFIHRNSLTYSLKKIEQILGVTLSSLDTCMQLHMGFLLQDLL